jgi:prolipoprotein diacylglyceryltransferase
MPVAFYLPGYIPVYLSTLILGLGTSLGLAWVAWAAAEQQRTFLLDAGLLALAGALIGGRAGFVFQHWAYFQSNPIESLQVFRGGLSGAGALAGGFLALVCLAAITRQSLTSLSYSLLPLAAAITVSAWLACWLDGCAYGVATDAWWGVPARDETGAVTRRIPTQLIGALLTLAWFVPLRASRGSTVAGSSGKQGLVAGLGFLGLSLELLLSSFVRADPGPSALEYFAHSGSTPLLRLSMETWGAIVLMVLSILGISMAILKSIRDKRGVRDRGLS